LSDRLQYTLSGYLTPEDIDSLSGDNYWVAAQDQVYVLDDYIAEGYTAVVYSGSAGINVNSSLVAITFIPVYASATLTSSSSAVSLANRIAPSSAALYNTTSINSEAHRTRSGTVLLPGVLNSSVSVSAKRGGETLLIVNSTLSVSANRTAPSSATLTDAGNETTWNTAGTWLEPTQEVWAKRVTVKGNYRITNNPASFAIVSSINIAPNRYRFSSNIVVDDLASLSVNAGLIARAAALLNINSDISIPFTFSAVGGFAQDHIIVNSSLSVVGILKVASGDWTVGINTTVNSVGVRPRTSNTSASTVRALTQITGVAIRRSSSTVNAATSTLVTNKRYRFSASILAGSMSTNVELIRTRHSSSNLLSTSDWYSNGGKRLGIALELLNSVVTLSANGIYVKVDPYRTIDVLQSQGYLITPMETRKCKILKQQRVNITPIEKRAITVLKSNRTWFIDRGQTVVVSESPYDEERI
tara:strand:+ start:1128 stop:2543 length:1416 start_codon:yes stop_codon:yes gene_type:complete